MKINKLIWAKCPECQIIINGWSSYPANIILEGYSNYYTKMICPNNKCSKNIFVMAKIEVTLEAVKEE